MYSEVVDGANRQILNGFGFHYEHEIVAEKIRAAYQRAKVRDLHDLSVYATKPLDRDLLRRLVVIKLWQVGDTFDAEGFVTRLQNGNYDWADLRRLVRATTKIDPDDTIAQTVAATSFCTISPKRNRHWPTMESPTGSSDFGSRWRTRAGREKQPVSSD